MPTSYFSRYNTPYAIRRNMTMKRRLTTRRRRTVKRRRGRITVQQANLLRNYADPFSLSVINPKIPDGKTNMSIGLRLQSVGEVQFGTSSITTFVVYAGFGCVCVANRQNNQILNTKSFPFEDHGQARAVIDATTNVPTFEMVGQAAQTAQWRAVSVGVKLSLINNAEENDGWVESVRLHLNNDPSAFALQPIANADFLVDGGDRDQPAVLVPNTKAPFNDQHTRNLANHPSYATCKLRNIHKIPFVLHPLNTDHDFSLVEPALKSSSTADLVAKKGVAFNQNSSESKFLDGNLDRNFDVLIIRVHGRSAAQGGTPTRLLVHTVSNQEIVYAEGSNMSRFMSRAPAANQSAVQAISTAVRSNVTSMTPGRGVTPRALFS